MAERRRGRTDDPVLLKEYAEDDRLSWAASQGDRSAMGAFLARNQRLLLATATRLAAGGVEPDDLLSDALVNLLTLWNSGTGPQEKVSAYVIQSMRNRMIDEFRSPRSRVVPLVDADDNLSLPTVVQDTRHIDLRHEYSLVREALLLLPADQQHVLRATIIDGRKPAELEEELGRSASSIYALGLRARRGLRRSMLRVVLEEDTPPLECRHAASRLPPTVTDDVADASDSPGMAHIRECPRCRGAWGRFASTASVLGVVTCLLVGNAVFSPASAQAAEHPDPPSNDAVPRGDGVAPGNRVGRMLWTALPVAAIVAGLVLLGFAVLPTLFGAPAGEEPDAHSELVVTTEIDGPDRASLDVSFTGAEATSTLTLSLPAGLTVASTPDAWQCATGDEVLECTITGPVQGSVALDDARDDASGDYRLEFSTTIGERTVTGAAWGQITQEAQTVRDSITGTP